MCEISKYKLFNKFCEKYNITKKLNEESSYYQFEEFLKSNGIINDKYLGINGSYERFIGLFHKHVNKNYNLTKKYYLMAVELGNIGAMNNLGLYYKNIEQNYDEMKKYYLMAIELNNANAMYNLGYYYDENENNYDLMKKYYLMAVELNHSGAMNNLGIHYKNIEQNYDLMKKYYFMAVKLGHSKVKQNLIIYMKSCNNLDELFSLSVLINNFDVINSQNHIKLFTHFCNLEKIEVIYPYLNKLTICDEFKQTMDNVYKLKRIHMLSLKQFNNIHQNIKNHIITF